MCGIMHQLTSTRNMRTILVLKRLPPWQSKHGSRGSAFHFASIIEVARCFWAVFNCIVERKLCS